MLFCACVGTSEGIRGDQEPSIQYKICPFQFCSCRNVTENGKKKLQIDCSNRNLIQIPTFSNWTGLPVSKLNLSNNRIASIPAKAFANLRSVERIDLGSNSFIYHKDINVSAFDGIEKNLRHLSMKDNGMNLAELSAWGFLRQLVNLETLILDKNKYGHVNLENDVFSHLNSLRKLTMNDCNIFKLMEHSFRGLSKLEVLEVARNELEITSYKALRSLTSLKSLDLESNEFHEISGNSFQNLHQLTELRLGDNDLTQIDVSSSSSNRTISANAFEGLRNLKFLDLYRCELTEVPSHAFSYIPNLTNLKLHYNNIANIPPGAFESLTSLTELDLDGNKELQLTQEMFQGVDTRLTKLWLRDLGLTSVPIQQLRNLTALQWLDLSQNTFKMLPENSFNGLTVTRLSLDNMGITSVENGAFNGLGKPLHVSLINNKIQNLDWVEPCQFDVLHLKENPINCTCRVNRIVKSSPGVIEGTCESPAAYQNKTFKDLFSYKHAHGDVEILRKDLTDMCEKGGPIRKELCSYASKPPVVSGVPGINLFQLLIMIGTLLLCVVY